MDVSCLSNREPGRRGRDEEVNLVNNTAKAPRTRHQGVKVPSRAVCNGEAECQHDVRLGMRLSIIICMLLHQGPGDQKSDIHII